MDKNTCAFAGITLLVFSCGALAIPIQGGSIENGGDSRVSRGGSHFTGIDFNCGPTCVGSVIGQPGPGGDLAGLGGLRTRPGELRRHDITYSNFPGNLHSQVFRDIDFGGLQYSFNMAGMNAVSSNIENDPNCRVAQDFGCLVLAGTGFFTIDGNGSNYKDTAGNWVYSYAGASFSSQKTALPEPGTIALLGLGLVGFGILRHIRKSA